MLVCSLARIECYTSQIQLPREGTAHSGLGLLMTDMAIGQSDVNNSSMEVPSSQVSLGCVKLTMKTDHHKYEYKSTKKHRSYLYFT